jgi:hypothetical protein
VIQVRAFEQTLVGSYELVSEPGIEQPLMLSLRSERARLIAPLSGELEVRGEIDARGLAHRRPARGRVSAPRLALGFSRYELEFEDDAGRPLRLRAARQTLSRFVGSIEDAQGERVASLELRLDLKAVFGRLLRRG